MASILDRYGIKEVSDVTFYELDDSGNPAAPVLYLDTLKVSTIETTAENVAARGGKGNPEIIIWDYNKEITLTLEDALFSAKSMAVMFGTVTASLSTAATGTIKKTLTLDEGTTTAPTTYEINGVTYSVPTSGVSYYDATGAVITTFSSAVRFMTFDAPAEEISKIEISAKTFPGTYYITGDTYARSESNGKDEFFQFVVYKAKVLSEVTLTMEAEGDPSTFTMNVKVLRAKGGKMMGLIKYNLSVGSSNEEE